MYAARGLYMSLDMCPWNVSLYMSLDMCPWNVFLYVSLDVRPWMCLCIYVPGMCPWNVSSMRLSGHVSLVCAHGILFSVPSQYSQE